jgi:Flp pilus assembly protein TadB
VANLGTLFALAILPVGFFLGLVTYGRLLQSGVEDTIYARAISRIRRLYGEINPSRAEYFRDIHSDRAGLRAMGLFRRWWQQFLTAAAMVAMVNAVVAGAFVAIAVARWVNPPALVSVAIGGGAALLVGASFYRHQRRAWNRVDQALPEEVTSG